MNKKPMETIMGIVVLFVAAFFLYFAYKVSDQQVVKGYEVTARFLKVGGLNVGSDVRINGNKVGTVVSQKLDNENYDAEIVMSLSSAVPLPKDSTAVIVGDGLIGDKFIKIEPGKSKEMLQYGDVITNVKDFKTIEDMVGEIIFMVTDNGEENK